MAEIRIQTANNVEIVQNLSDLGNRIIAHIIDGFVLGVIVSILYMPMIFIFTQSPNSLIIPFFQALLYIAAFLYSPIMCTIKDGQTFGKMAMGLKVIKLDGSKPTFGNYLIRRLLFIVDGFFCGVVGIVVVSNSNLKQRVGDMAAGTIVITTKPQYNNVHNTYNPNNQSTQNAPNIYKPIFDKVVLLSTDDIRVINEVLERQKDNSSLDLLSRTATKLKTILQVENTLLSDIDFLRQVQKDYDYLNKK